MRVFRCPANGGQPAPADADPSAFAHWLGNALRELVASADLSQSEVRVDSFLRDLLPPPRPLPRRGRHGARLVAVVSVARSHRFPWLHI
jgi:hypothetical protein